MLDVDFAALRQGFARYMPLGGMVAGVLAVEMVVVSATVATRMGRRRRTRAHGAAPDVTNAEAIGRVLYTDYVYFFQAAGMVLLVAMIGAIVLTLRHKPGVSRQVDRATQVARDPPTGMRMVSIKPGEGIERHDHRPRPLSGGRRDPVHHRRVRHLREPQEHHRHPDVDRADPAGGEHQPGRVLGLSAATWSGRSSPCSC